MSAEDQVRHASEQFYAALNSMLGGDTGPMANVWQHSPDATTMHPIGGREVGWDAVKVSFDQFAGASSPGGHVRLDDQRLQVIGDLAYELGTERGKVALAGHDIAIDSHITNIYRRDAGTWKMVHHHGDVSEAVLNVLKRMQAGA